jgi:lysyl-tRNA synthetase class 2
MSHVRSPHFFRAPRPGQKKSGVTKGFYSMSDNGVILSGDAAYRQQRLATIAGLKEAGVDVYPHKFDATHDICEARAAAAQTAEDGRGSAVRVSGRIVAIRAAGAALLFMDIRGETDGRGQPEAAGRLQVVYNKKDVVEDGALTFAAVAGALRVGDIIGVEGLSGCTKAGELSVFARVVRPLAWCLHMLPERNKLTDEDIRWRERHVDLLVNDAAARVAVMRPRIIRLIREFFWERNFIEVETPAMCALAGGANAKPFRTHLNALDMDMFLRIAPELYLKQLVVGGMPRVFEIGKNFRNEGCDRTHNPEFTAIEAYWAGEDYNDWMTTTEMLMETIAKNVMGAKDGVIEYRQVDGTVVRVDFCGPYPRYPMIKTLEEKLGVTFPHDLSAPETQAWLSGVLAKRGVECEEPRTMARMLDKLVGVVIEPLCTQPSFITDHPQLMCPLAKWHRDDPTRLTERFELFVCGRELCNAYTELNDPEKQRAGFAASAGDRDAGDVESMPSDEAFCRALEYGLTPTGGWGMGIDRLVMFLTNCQSIRDVILFPTMRPTAEETEAQKRVLATDH